MTSVKKRPPDMDQNWGTNYQFLAHNSSFNPPYFGGLILDIVGFDPF